MKCKIKVEYFKLSVLRLCGFLLGPSRRGYHSLPYLRCGIEKSQLNLKWVNGFRELRLLAVLTNGFGIIARIFKYIKPYGLNLAQDQSFGVRNSVGRLARETIHTLARGRNPMPRV